MGTSTVKAAASDNTVEMVEVPADVLETLYHHQERYLALRQKTLVDRLEEWNETVVMTFLALFALSILTAIMVAIWTENGQLASSILVGYLMIPMFYSAIYWRYKSRLITKVRILQEQQFQEEDKELERKLSD